jgi:peptidyl-prolyl cis-trans isomerase C
MKFFAVLPLTLAVSLFAQTKPATAPKAPAQPRSAGAADAATPGKSAVPASSPAAPSAAPAVDDNKVVMTIGDQKITAKEFDQMIEALPPQYQAQARGPMKRQVAEQIARVKMLASEARKRGLDKDPLTQSRIRFQEDNLLAGATYNDLIQKTKVDDAALQNYYNEHKNEYETVTARHILIKFKGSPVPQREGKPELTEEQALAKAQDIKKQLAGGADFSALAKAESDDAGSGANGGELGSFARGQMVPDFENAAFKLPAGQVSDPIKTQFGYHLIRVDKHDTKALTDVKTEITEKVKPEAAKKAVEDMRKSATVSLDDSYFGPEAAAPGAVGQVVAPPQPGAVPKPQAQ